ncbi:YebC/PmpR family DNA-binding transcriptional regulator [Apibacter muscae]|uniref:Probable transcriptional regulatory protein ETU09_03870 n=1 Tax=Apibacter muscae TaxID=2509004 RepID=A0A563DGJ8_9FLAO|nr:YebC/PmpR family DNA-binding transcriptional regulator [Apibacter muscae]TWP28983.1 YebC/PmpR family DNA-binding transcriptional regulator [Apibacter muscae]TWP30442.1 YebC/PmpR family DNA-binding transcriptional regulator [Apibacter muscae]
MGRAFEYRKASKLARWDKMAKQFSRIGKEIAIAVKAGGPNPEANPALRRCLLNAKGVNMPKDNVERAIKKASGADAEQYDEVTYEGYGPGGIAIFLECTTNNTTRTVANVRAIFNKFDGNLGKNGELTFVFDRKGIFTLDKDSIAMDWEDFELEMIDAGAEEVDIEDNEVIITSSFEDFGSINHKFEELKIEPKSADLQRLPNTMKTLPLDQAQTIMKMLEKFEDDDDVQHVFHNMEITEELQSSL